MVKVDTEVKLLLHDAMNKLQVVAGRIEQAGKAATDLISAVEKLSRHLASIPDD